jgi:hypothetical protein
MPQRIDTANRTSASIDFSTNPVELLGGSPSPTSSSPASPDPSGPADESGPYEKWLVRILLTLAFGLAFGIEGMTLIRSFVVDTEDEATTQPADQRPLLREGTVLAPSVAPGVRVRQLRVRATEQAWRFTLVARPDSARDRPVTLSFDRLTSTDGTPFTSAPRHTWAPSDTASFVAAWPLPVGQRPETLTVTTSTSVGPDSTRSATRTFEMGHVPVRQ